MPWGRFLTKVSKPLSQDLDRQGPGEPVSCMRMAFLRGTSEHRVPR